MTAPEKKSFKPYIDISAGLGKELYERLIQAFSEMDPHERPWCGIGAKVDLIAISPRGVTVAVIKELSGAEKGVVHVSQNWREPWYVETVDNQKVNIEENPCEQAERAINAIKSTLDSFLRAHDQRFPRVKCLITFPDAYDFKGPKDFSILDRDEVMTLKLRNFRDLPEAILQPAQHETLDSRKYRKWIESALVTGNDDSIAGTWLDPAFDKPEAERPKGQPWRLRRPGQQRLAEQEKVSSSDSSQTRRIQARFAWGKPKLAITVITATIIGIMGWRLYDGDKPTPSVSYAPRPVSPPRTENPTNATKVIPASMLPDTASLAENKKPDALPAPEITKPSEVQKPELAGKNQPIEAARKSNVQASEDSELKRQKIELQIRRAIHRRAITGVTVSFIGDTAYLKGEVETEKQKSAAEKAARSVPGVKGIRNSIDINRLLAADGLD
jgi:BON domain/Nuclease-related domain